MLKFLKWAHNVKNGFKISVPTQTYNVTVDHSCCILNTTMGHPGTWNNKTLVLFDELVCKVRNGDIPDNFEFILYERGSNNDIVEVSYKGARFMVDNGYLVWHYTVPPDSNDTTYETK